MNAFQQTFKTRNLKVSAKTFDNLNWQQKANFSKFSYFYIFVWFYAQMLDIDVCFSEIKLLTC
jgi:hypothetical protein